jgi:uncharacterized membrane protein YdbT with pleckstrin-like domain
VGPVKRSSQIVCSWACAALSWRPLPYWRANSLMVTNRQVVWKKGLIGTQERSVPLHQVQDVSVSYKPIGQLLGYGTIRIETAGGPETEIVAERIAGPGEVRDAILDQLASKEQE